MIGPLENHTEEYEPYFMICLGLQDMTGRNEGASRQEGSSIHAKSL